MDTDSGTTGETNEGARLLLRVAAAICSARVDANPDGCGGGGIGWHAIGEPGRCDECQREARNVIRPSQETNNGE